MLTGPAIAPSTEGNSTGPGNTGRTAIADQPGAPSVTPAAGAHVEPAEAPPPTPPAPEIRHVVPGLPLVVTVPIVVIPKTADAPPPGASADPEPAAEPAQRAAVEPAAPATPPTPSLPVIALDPGHGGIDPGTHSASGLEEKTVTLAAAKALKAVLEASGRYAVVLTRDDDSFVRLRERVAIARAAHARLMVSLHADSYANPLLKGASIYTQSDQASDHEAALLAQHENQADQIGGVDLATAAPAAGAILIDLSQRVTHSESTKFARAVSAAFRGTVPLVANPHREAGFAVLSAPDMPAVLVELGYLSNRSDAERLGSNAGMHDIAEGLARAIDRFIDHQAIARSS